MTINDISHNNWGYVWCDDIDDMIHVRLRNRSIIARKPANVANGITRHRSILDSYHTIPYTIPSYRCTHTDSVFQYNQYAYECTLSRNSNINANTGWNARCTPAVDEVKKHLLQSYIHKAQFILWSSSSIVSSYHIITYHTCVMLLEYIHRVIELTVMVIQLRPYHAVTRPNSLPIPIPPHTHTPCIMHHTSYMAFITHWLW